MLLTQRAQTERGLSYLIDEFWKWWKKDYLLDLKSAHTRETPSPTPPKEGDLVLIAEDKMPCLMWRTGLGLKFIKVLAFKEEV